MGYRKQKTSFLEDLFHVLTSAPIWVGPTLATFAFIFFAWLFPWFLAPSAPNDVVRKNFWNVLQPISRMLAPGSAGVIMVIWAAAELKKHFDRRRLDRQTGIQSIRDLSWQEFEGLLAEVFRRQGYAVKHVGGAGADGGVDLDLYRAGETTLVQCKQWHVQRVGVNIVRELYGVVASEKAHAGIVVTSGRFTPEAMAFGRNLPLTLIAGDELEQLIQAVKVKSQSPTSAPLSNEIPRCPKCGAAMKRKLAKAGANAGSEFWGCPQFPDCRGTRSL